MIPKARGNQKSRANVSSVCSIIIYLTVVTKGFHCPMPYNNNKGSKENSSLYPLFLLLLPHQTVYVFTPSPLVCYWITQKLENLISPHLCVDVGKVVDPMMII